MNEPASPGRGSLTGRLLGMYAVIFVAVLVLFTAVVTAAASRVLENQIVEGLVDQARVIETALAIGEDGVAPAPAPATAAAAAMASTFEGRLTIVLPDGSVQFDSDADPSAMENHGTRPEVLDAWDAGVGTDTRDSGTLGDERLYVAVRDSTSTRVIRLSVTAEQLSADLAEVRWAVVNVAAMVGVVGLFLVWGGARRVSRPIIELTAIAEGVADGDITPTVRRSSVAEVDRLGVSIGRMASQLGRRLEESDTQRHTLESVLGALPQGVVLIGPADEILYSNETARSLVGPFGDRLSSIVPRALHRCVAGARDDEGERHAEFERGSPARTLSVAATKIAADGRVLVVVVDITEQKRVEAIRRDFVADASHELKTPVAGMLASTEAMQLALSRDPEKARGFAARAETSARQLSRIVEDLLDLSRLESSDRVEEPVRLDRVVLEEVEGFRARAGESGIEMTVQVTEVEIVGSPPDLALAVRNLCDNALRYTDRGGSVTARLERSEMEAVISVQDTGIGIPTRALERVFERFYRVDDARSRSTGGTGLGLAIVRHVAERHGGIVTVTSQLGVGSTFSIRLPRTG